MRHPVLGLVVLFFLVLLFAGGTLFWGPTDLSFQRVWSALFFPGSDVSATQILWELRMPRVFAGLFAGASLGLSGLVLQSVFRNPLAGPFVLGVSSGASLGVALVLLAGFGRGSLGILSAAAMGAFGVIFLVLFCSKFLEHSVSLLIVGLMLGYLIDAMVSLLMYFSDAESLRGFVTWGMGSFSRLTLLEAPRFAGVFFVGFALILAGIRYLNVVRLGDAFAESLGIAVRPYRLIVLAGASLLAAGATVYCGPISFLGLAVPHLAYGIFRSSNHRVLIPACALLGALLALMAGWITEIPLNAVTSLLGVPVVLWVLLASRHRRSGGVRG